MSLNTAIKVQSLSKTYRLYNSKHDFIKETFHPLRKKYHNKFHALKEISFSVKKGEVLGIIGENGSGKSTLLKILASVVTPTSGECNCNGRVTALLELSGGFNRQLTGIQNINFLGKLYGFSKSEMAHKTKQILDFAEIGEYAYQPIKSYSSGMYMRLAFSLSIHIDPEILIVDEILAVGDAKFRLKCLQRIKKFKDDGKTIVICSHSLETVNNFCSKAIWLHEGEIKEEGSPKTVTEHYMKFMVSLKTNAQNKKSPNIETLTSLSMEIPELSNTYPKILWADLSQSDSYGLDVNFIKCISLIQNETNKNITILKGGESLKLLVYVLKKQKIVNPALHILLKGKQGMPLFKINSNTYNQKLSFADNKPTVLSIDFTFPNIGNGNYSLSLGILSLTKNAREDIHWVNDALNIKVSNPDNKYKIGSLLVIENASFQIQTIESI